MMKHAKIITAVLIVSICGLAVGIGFIERWTIRSFAREEPISYLTLKNYFILLACLFCALILWSSFSLMVSIISRTLYFEVLCYDSYSYLPFLLYIIFTIGQKSYFLSLRFFQENNNLLLIFCASGMVYLKIRYIKILLKRYSESPVNSYLRRIKSRFYSEFFEGRKWKLNLFLFTFCLYLLLASGIFFHVYLLTGDEPHYVMITHSILKDHDLEVSNNYDNRDYELFYPGFLDTHASRGKVSRHLKYPMHPPGLSLWLMPFYYVGLFLGRDWLLFMLRGSMCLLAALLSVYLVDLLKELFHDRKIALLSWVAVGFTSPLLFYSRHLYTEIPAALISLLVVRAIRRMDNLNWRKILLVGFGIGILPWIGQKYLSLAIALILAVLFYIWKNKALLSSKMLFALPLLLLIGLYFFYIYALYGDFSPMSIKLGYQEPQIREEWRKSILWNWEIKPKIACLMSYFIDQKDGLLICSPIYLFIFIGFYAFYRSNKRDFWLLLWVLGSHLGIYAYMHETTGHCPPTRALVAIIWILGVLLAAGFKIGVNRWAKSLKIGLLVISLIIALLLSLNFEFLYQWIIANRHEPSKLYLKLSNIYIDFTKLLPSLLDFDILSYRAIIFWLAVFCVILFGLFLLNRKKDAPEKSDRVPKYSISIISTIAAISIGILLFFLLPRVHLDRLYQMEFFPPKPYRIYSIEGNIWGPELGGFWTKGEREARFIMQTSQQAKELLIKLRSPVKQRIKFGIADFCCEKEIKIKGRTSFKLSLPKPFLYKKSWLYLITIEPQSGYLPSKIEGTKDGRFLGVFVRLTPILRKKRKWEAPGKVGLKE